MPLSVAPISYGGVYKTLTGKNAPAGPSNGYTGQKATPNPVASNQAAIDKSQADWAALSAEIRRLQNSIAAQPKLASFDVMSNWRNAQSAAEKAQNPVYDRYLKEFLARNVQKKDSKTREFGLTQENIGLEKTQALEDSATQRVRTTEDTQAAIDKINQQEGYYQKDEGNQFDTDYRKLAEEINASGGAQTGLGRQQTYDAIKLRNITNERQLDEFKGQRQAKQIFKERTFEDLARGDLRAEQLATNKTKAAQFDFEDYLNELAYDEVQFRNQNETARLEAVLRDTQNYEKAGVESFLAGLAGKGYSAKDIAYNRSVYA